MRDVIVDEHPDTRTPAAALVARLDAVAERLSQHAAADDASALAEPDPNAGERWNAGQVWGHIAESYRYWLTQTRMVLAARSSKPVPCGRSSTDPGRVAAIEAGRRESSLEPLASRLESTIAEVRALLVDLTLEAWSLQVEHRSLGTMDLAGLVDYFLVSHLEGHADQLDALGSGRG